MTITSSNISSMEDDDTSAGLAPGAPTTIHEPVLEPEPALAYSEALELPDLHRPSRLPVVLFAGAVAALVAAAGAWFLVRPAIAQNPPADPAPAATSSQPAPSPAAQTIPDPVLTQPMPNAGHLAAPSVDDTYITQLTAAGITIHDRDGVIHNGHVLCEALASGQTDSQIVPGLRQQIPSFTIGNAEGMLAAAVAAYCPQYAGQLGTY